VSIKPLLKLFISISFFKQVLLKIIPD